jgi:hypothetical protein
MKQAKPLESLILTVRGQKIILDSDLARLYGAPTFRLNEAFKRNRKRFPEDFAFQLTAQEAAALRRKQSEVTISEEDMAMSSQIAMTSNQSQNVTGLTRKRPISSRPWAFTEHGALMVANILRTDRAIEMSVFVIRAFVRMREQIAGNAAILKRLAEIDKSLLEHDQALAVIWSKLEPLLAPPPEPKKRQIGFKQDEESM